MSNKESKWTTVKMGLILFAIIFVIQIVRCHFREKDTQRKSEIYDRVKKLNEENKL